MIKQAIISLINDDSSAYPNAQATYNGKATKYTRLSPYGLDTNPPNGSWILLINSQAQESNKFGIASDFLNRKKNLIEGEVVLHNTQTQSFVYLKSNGDIEINSTGDISMTGTNVNITGDVVVTGDIDATGTITGTTDVVAGTISGKTHVHPGVTVGAGSTGAPV
jgi:phage gp45-like